jgi:hypothetical protein
MYMYGTQCIDINVFFFKLPFHPSFHRYGPQGHCRMTLDDSRIRILVQKNISFLIQIRLKYN